ncbi:MAG: heme biosynthesis HemY N-terminal domain-containing protein, partial [Pseudomonadota bacterium]
FGRWRKGRLRDKGYNALSKGLIAANSGNAKQARLLAKESGKYLTDEPLVAMLDAQTSLLEGDHDKAREKFETMLENDDTRLLGLRGLHIEAEQEGAAEAAAHFANQANKEAPGTPWATQAVLRGQAMVGNWEEALRTLETNRSAGLFEADEYKYKKAVLLTALAQQEEAASPDKAKAHGLAAHKLQPGFAPAAVVTARVAARLGDLRKAAKVLETTWKDTPHPDVADAYVHLRIGDSAEDRLKRAVDLNTKRAHNVEGQYVLAKASIEAEHFSEARDAMKAILRNETTERACLLMADIEEAEHGDRGRVREWLSRAVTATRDAAWVADGIAVEEWKPCSPVSGRIGAFEWKIPVDERSAALEDRPDYSQLTHEVPVAVAPAVVEDATEAGSGVYDAADEVAEMKVVSKSVEDVAPETPKAGSTGGPKVAKTAIEAQENMTVAGAAGTLLGGAAATSFKGSDATELVSEPTATSDKEDPSASDDDAVEVAEEISDDKVIDLSTAKADLASNGVSAKSPNVPEAQASGFVSMVDPKETAAGSQSEDQTETVVTASSNDGAETAGDDLPKKSSSPFKNADLDPDQDGVLDRRPDDPGIDGSEPEPKRGILF